jgi:hypothetical protein
MSQLEEDLRKVLQRKQPPDGFAERVMARVSVTMPSRRPKPVWRWVGAVAACLTLAAGVGQYQEYRRGVEAKEQVMFALGLTSEKLAAVQQKVTEELNRK